MPCLTAPLPDARELQSACAAADIAAYLERGTCCGKSGCGCAPRMQLLVAKEDVERVAHLLDQRWKALLVREGTADIDEAAAPAAASAAATTARPNIRPAPPAAPPRRWWPAPVPTAACSSSELRARRVASPTCPGTSPRSAGRPAGRRGPTAPGTDRTAPRPGGSRPPARRRPARPALPSAQVGRGFGGGRGFGAGGASPRRRCCSSSSGTLTSTPMNEALNTTTGSARQPSITPMTASSLPSPSPSPSRPVM